MSHPAAVVLYGPDGQPLPEDRRDGWQREFDRMLRNKELDPRFYREMERTMKIRDDVKEQARRNASRKTRFEQILESEAGIRTD